MTVIRRNTARMVLVGPVLDADGVAKTNETVANIRITKNGTVASAHGSTTLTHHHAGKYLLAMDAADSDAPGVMQASLSSGTNDMPVMSFNVVEDSIFDSLFAASAAGFDGNQRVDVGNWRGTSVPAPTVAGIPRVEVVAALAAFFQDCFTVDSGEVSGAEVSGSLILEIVRAVWDRVLTGSTHNTATSAGRRLRQVEAAAVHASGTIATVTDGHTITLDAGAVATADYYIGDRLDITEGLGAGQSRLITAYTSGKVCTLDSNFTVNPNTSSLYDVVAADVHVSLSDADLAGGFVAVYTNTTTITLDSGAVGTTDYYKDQVIIFTHGAGKGQSAQITAYTSGRVCTLSPALTTPLDTTTNWHITSNAGTENLGGMSTGMKAEVQAEADAALAALNLDHLMKEPVASNSDMTTEVIDGTVLSNMMSKTSDTSTFVISTDSLEGNRDASLTAAQSQAASDAALVANHLDHLLKVDYDPASKPGTATALFNELIESNSGVSRYTAAALAQAPSGSGGDATEAKQDEILVDLVDMKGTGFAKDTDSMVNVIGADGDTLKSLSDQIDGIVGGTGTGARTVAVTVNDGAAVLENAIVRYTEGANTYAGPTNASGQISFSLDDATYSVAISKVGYTFTPTTLVVDGDKTPTYSMTVVTITSPPNASTTTGVMTVYDEEGSVEQSVSIHIQILDGPGTAGIGYDSTVWTETSSALGIVQFSGIILGARYKIWRGTTKAAEETFTAPSSGTSFDLAELIGRG